MLWRNGAVFNFLYIYLKSRRVNLFREKCLTLLEDIRYNNEEEDDPIPIMEANACGFDGARVEG